MNMSEIDGGRVGTPVAIPQRVGNAIRPARPGTDHESAPRTAHAPAPYPVALTAAARGTNHTSGAAGFLAQAIAQEALLLGVRAPNPDQRGPVALYRQIQDDAPPEPETQSGIDLKI